MTTLTATIEMQFSGTAWTDVSADVRRTPAWHVVQGLGGASPTDRVASAGRFSFSLDNSETNSGGTIGYYSPGHAACRSGFDLGVPTRLKLSGGTVTAYYAFYGLIRSIEPMFGASRERRTDIIVGDYMEQLSTKKIKLLPVQLSKRNDQLAGTIVAAMPIQPLATSYATGPDVFASALNAEQDEKATGLSVLQKCMQSGMDYCYTRGDTTGGETLAYESRHTRIRNSTASGTINNEMAEFRVVRSTDDIWNSVSVVAYPDDYDSAAVIIYSSSDEKEIGAGQSVTFTARYRDPAGLSQRTSLYPGSEVTPVAHTDYIFCSVSESNTEDMNSYLGVSVTWGGNSAEVTLTNNGTRTGYVQAGFQLRGIGIYHYDPVTTVLEDMTSIDTYGEKSINYTMPYQSDINVARDCATVIRRDYKDPLTRVENVSFIANRSDALMNLALAARIGSRVKLIETVTGVNADYYINSVDYTVEANNILCVRWVVERAGTAGYFILNDNSHGRLNTNAYLRF